MLSPPPPVIDTTGPSGWRSRVSCGLRRLWRQNDGATAMELAFIAVPFIGLTFAIIETGVMAFTNTVVQGAIGVAARQVRTGQPGVLNSDTTCGTPPAATLAAFRTAVCNGVDGQIDCNSLYFYVQSFATFGAVSLPAATFDSQGNQVNQCYDTGVSSAPSATGNDIVAVQVIYNWHTITPGLNYILGAGASQTYPIQYTMVFKNEPY
ncbi:MAG TPA: TadE/TadG family type IV pilus assembly protein [Patescibacteria group bacterium]|nr:TadE/TadG family type IV pilus assembly protein [Patescibacteria group bacterium]